MKWFLAAFVASPAYGQMTPAGAASAKFDAGAASAPVAPQAAALFERHWVLANWALRKFDFNRDILLSAGESAAAADAFRKIADGNSDGRVTPVEYRAARDFILARY